MHARMETRYAFFYFFYFSEANWGSSAQAQVFVSALKGVQTLTETQEHVKNYRPKVRTCERLRVSLTLKETQEHVKNYRPMVRTCDRLRVFLTLKETQEHVKNYRPKVRSCERLGVSTF